MIDISHKAKRFDWWILIALAIISLCFGMYGFYIHSVDTLHREPLLTDLAYRTAQLFTLESGAVDPPTPLSLDIARWLSPLVTFFAIVKSVISLVHRQTQTMFRMHTIKDHAIICGLSKKGIHVAKSILDLGYRVVIVELNENNADLTELVSQGAVLTFGDASDPAIMSRVKVTSARFVFALTDDDTKNISIIHTVYRCIDHLAESDQKLDCYAHVTDQTIKTLFYSNPLFADSSMRFNAQLFNLYDKGARILLETYAPDRNRHIGSTSDPAASIILLGSSPLASSLIQHIARIGHYANKKKPIVTIVDSNASKLLGTLLLSLPALEDILDIQLMDKALAELTTKNLRDLIEQQADTIYVCANDIAQNIALTRRLTQLAKQRKPVIVAALTESNALTQLFFEGQTGSYRDIALFSLFESTLSPDQLINAKQDTAAKLIHQNYLDDQMKQGTTLETNRSLSPWDALSEAIKDSNRGQADHLPIKLRALGLQLESVATDPLSLDFSEEQVDLLAEMEHRRWVADKQLNGWRFTEGQRNDELKLSPLLVAFDRLPDSEKHKDRQTVYTLTKLIDLMRTPNPTS